MSGFTDFTTLSFDCYGTLIDWETGIANALRPWSDRHSLGWTNEDLIAAHARFETHVQQERPQALYPDVLAETLRRIGESVGRDVSAAEATAYGASVPTWPAFPDSGDTLRALQDRYRLVILSNVDRSSFAASNERLGVEFDLIVTAEDVGSYKPNLANFTAMFDALAGQGVDRSNVLHVAESLYHDHEPAQQVGLPSVWIHRRHGKDGLGATAPPSAGVEPARRYRSMEQFAAAALS